MEGATTSFYQADGLGSVTSLTDSSVAIANTYTYDSFGNQTISTGTVVNPFRYTARELDSETGLMFYRARYYDPGAGRFASEDDLGLTPETNRLWRDNKFLYTRNTPPNLVDRSGRSPVVLIFGAAGLYIAACANAATARAKEAFTANEDKKRHCFGGCFFARCTALLGPPAVAIAVSGMVGWEVVFGWAYDSAADIEAGVWGLGHAILPQSCKKICDKCQIK